MLWVLSELIANSQQKSLRLRSYFNSKRRWFWMATRRIWRCKAAKVGTHDCPWAFQCEINIGHYFVEARNERGWRLGDFAEFSRPFAMNCFLVNEPREVELAERQTEQTATKSTLFSQKRGDSLRIYPYLIIGRTRKFRSPSWHRKALDLFQEGRKIRNKVICRDKLMQFSWESFFASCSIRWLGYSESNTDADLRQISTWVINMNLMYLEDANVIYNKKRL